MCVHSIESVQVNGDGHSPMLVFPYLALFVSQTMNIELAAYSTLRQGECTLVIIVNCRRSLIGYSNRVFTLFDY